MNDIELIEPSINHDSRDRHCEERSDAAIQEVRGHGLPRCARSDVLLRASR